MFAWHDALFVAHNHSGHAFGAGCKRYQNVITYAGSILVHCYVDNAASNNVCYK